MSENKLEVEEYNVIPHPATFIDYLKKHLKEFGLTLGWYVFPESATAVILPRRAFWTVGRLGIFQDIFESWFKENNYGPGRSILDHPFVIAFFDYSWKTQKNTLVMKASAAEKHYQALKTLQEGHLKYLERYENKFFGFLSDKRKEQFEKTKQKYKKLEIKVVKPTNFEDVPL